MTETLIIDKEKVNLFMQEVGIKRYSELAQKADLHPNTLTKVLRGEGWTSETAIKLARVLHCNPIDLQTTNGYDDPKSDALVALSVLGISFLSAVALRATRAKRNRNSCESCIDKQKYTC